MIAGQKDAYLTKGQEWIMKITQIKLKLKGPSLLPSSSLLNAFIRLSGGIPLYY